MVVELHHQFAHHIWLCHIYVFLVLLRFQNSLRRTLGRRVWSKNGNHCLWGKAESDRMQGSSSFSRLGNSPSCCGAWCLYTSGGETKRLSSVKKNVSTFLQRDWPFDVWRFLWQIFNEKVALVSSRLATLEKKIATMSPFLDQVMTLTKSFQPSPFQVWLLLSLNFRYWLTVIVESWDQLQNLENKL